MKRASGGWVAAVARCACGLPFLAAWPVSGCAVTIASMPDRQHRRPELSPRCDPRWDGLRAGILPGMGIGVLHIAHGGDDPNQDEGSVLLTAAVAVAGAAVGWLVDASRCNDPSALRMTEVPRLELHEEAP